MDGAGHPVSEHSLVCQPIGRRFDAGLLQSAPAFQQQSRAVCGMLGRQRHRSQPLAILEMEKKGIHTTKPAASGMRFARVRSLKIDLKAAGVVCGAHGLDAVPRGAIPFAAVCMAWVYACQKGDFLPHADRQVNHGCPFGKNFARR